MNAAARQEDVSKYPLARSTSPLASGSPGSQITILAAQRPAERLARRGQPGRPRHGVCRPHPRRPTPTPGHRPSPPAAATSPRTGPARSGWGSAPPTATRIARTITNTGGSRRCGPARSPPALDVGEPQVALQISPGDVAGPRRRVRRQIHRPQLPDPVPQHPHGALPADPLGDHRRRDRRPRLQQLPDPRLDRVHERAPRHALYGGAVAAQRRPTVFREHPITLAIALIGIPSARCSRRISAHCSTDNTSLPSPARLEPGNRGSAFVCRKGVSFQAPPTHVRSSLVPRVLKHRRRPSATTRSPNRSLARTAVWFAPRRC